MPCRINDAMRAFNELSRHFFAPLSDAVAGKARIPEKLADSPAANRIGPAIKRW
jgi:hypothetical protein